MNTYDIILIGAFVTAIVALWIANIKSDNSDLKKAKKNRFSSLMVGGINGFAGGTVGAAVMHGIEHNRYWIPVLMFVVLVLNNVLIRKYQQSKSGNNQLNK